MGKAIAIFNQKGGVGKTTTNINLAACLAIKGKRVLILDIDPQGNTTSGVGISKKDLEITTHEILIEDKYHPEEAILPTGIENLDIMPASVQLAGAEVELIELAGREKRLKRAIDILKPKYDYIFIDLSPSYDLIARNFMLISDSIITPLEYQDIASIRGCELFYQKFNQDLEEMEMTNEAKRAVVINSYTNRKLSSGDIFSEYLDTFNNIKQDLLETKISDTTIVKNAILNKMDIDDYLKKMKKAHKIREEFNNFIEELLRREVL